MRQLRDAKARTWIIHLPIPLFGLLLQLWALISRQPAFLLPTQCTHSGHEFEVIDWPGIFRQPTPLAEALRITFQDSRLAKVVMPF